MKKFLSPLLFASALVLGPVGCADESDDSDPQPHAEVEDAELRVFLGESPYEGVQALYVTVSDVRIKEGQAQFATTSEKTQEKDTGLRFAAAGADSDAFLTPIDGGEDDLSPDGDEENDGPWTTLISGPLTVDLMALRAAPMELGGASIPAQSYNAMSVVVERAVVVVDGVEHPVEIPAQYHAGVEIPVDLRLGEGLSHALLLQVDAAASLTQTGTGNYVMSPVLRPSMLPGG